MEKFSRKELDTVAERLNAALADLNVKVVVSPPDGVALVIPDDLKGRPNEVLAELAFKALTATGVRIHLDLEVSFYQTEIEVDNYRFTIILNGTPKSEFN